MPTTPPHVRLPISVPSLFFLNRYATMSPSEAENSSMSSTFGPYTMPPGSGAGAAFLAMSIIVISRFSRSMIWGETLPPPFPLASTMSASLRNCG